MSTSILPFRIPFSVFCCCFLFVCAPVPEVGAEEPELVVPRLETFATSFRDAAGSTRRRLLEGLRQDLEGTTVLFQGSVWSMSEAKVGQSTATMPNRGAQVFAWEYGGMIARADVQVGEPPSPVDRIRHQLGGADLVTLIVIRDGARQVYALSANPHLIDRIRTGLELEVAVRVSGMNEGSLFGFLEDIGSPPSVLRCTCGRQVPSESEFRYCPFCGEPLESAPSTSSTQTE